MERIARHAHHVHSTEDFTTPFFPSSVTASTHTFFHTHTHLFASSSSTHPFFNSIQFNSIPTPLLTLALVYNLHLLFLYDIQLSERTNDVMELSEALAWHGALIHTYPPPIRVRFQERGELSRHGRIRNRMEWNGKPSCMHGTNRWN